MTNQRPPSSENTDWTWRHETPLSRFLRTESGSATVLLAATVASLVLANIAGASYRAAWSTARAVRGGGPGVGAGPVRPFARGRTGAVFLSLGRDARRGFAA